MRNTSRLPTKAIKKAIANDATQSSRLSQCKSAKLKLNHRRIGHSAG